MENRPSTHHPARSGEPDRWVKTFAPEIPKGEILDLACGGGRHGRYFLERGYSVTFIDKDLSGVKDLAQQPHATLVQKDLEDGSPFPFRIGQFSGIVVVNYLYRPLLPCLTNALSNKGMLIYKTFAQGNEQFGRPRNPDFLLRVNELIDAFSPDLKVIAFRHGRESNPDRMTQAICAVKLAKIKTDPQFSPAIT